MANHRRLALGPCLHMRAATSLEAADGASALQMPARRHMDLGLIDQYAAEPGGA